MKKIITLMLLLSSVAIAQNNASTMSPAEIGIAQARQAIQKKPSFYSGYNSLAIALARRARETSDITYYAQADEAVQKSLELAPGNLDGEKLRVWLLLGRHEFPAALEAAKVLNKKVPDDVLIYGFLTDANAELGNYDDAEKSAQWMLNLRAGNLPGVTRASYLRELFGDIDGALELMNMAFESTPPTETEDRAWILSQIGHLQFMQGNLEVSEKVLQQALVVFPGYHYALGNLAKVKIQQKKYGEAVSLLQQRFQAAPHAENLYDLADALELAGRSEEAKKAFTEFETKSLAESVRKDNSTRELIFYYADRAHQPEKALEFAKNEYSWRHDVYTRDAYAWALHVNGDDNEARKQIDAAIAIGIRDGKIFLHAGEIALQLGDRVAAENYLQKAVALNSYGSDQARARLADLTRAAR